jgi:hypothetical protein
MKYGGCPRRSKMYFLLSGEGPTDIGVALHDGVCEASACHLGPMALLVDQIVEARHGYSPLEALAFGMVSEGHLAVAAKSLSAVRKSPTLRGLKRPRETLYFTKNARALARIATQKAAREEVDVVAILFRDSDGTVSAGRGLWEDKRSSMVRGFEQEGYQRGVPMIPKPKSEAWLLCAVKYVYQGCIALESRSGNDDSPNSLKAELWEHLEGAVGREELCEMVSKGAIDAVRLQMPSFSVFRDRLLEVIV